MDNKELEKRVKWYERKYGPYIEKRGLNNWKNLFKKPILLEWVILAMIIMAIFMAFAYQSETAQCRDVIANPCLYCNNFFGGVTDNYVSEDLSEFKLKEETYLINGEKG